MCEAVNHNEGQRDSMFGDYTVLPFMIGYQRETPSRTHPHKRCGLYLHVFVYPSSHPPPLQKTGQGDREAV